MEITGQMGAETTVYCRVLVAHEEWRKVQAVTLSEAIIEATKLPGVIRVMEVSYEPGGVVT